MIVTCSKCETNFLVSTEQLGVSGRKVRCGNCMHVWHQDAPTVEAVVAEKEIIKNQEENLREAVKQQADGVKPSLPTVLEDNGSFKMLRALIVLLVVANALAFVVTNKPLIGQTGFYDLIGQYDTDGVIISEVSLLEPKEENGKLINYVAWTVSNTRKTKMEMPIRRIRLLDKNMKQILQGQDDAYVALAAGASNKFEPNNFPADDPKMKYLVLEIGNPYELSLRQ